ncbi:hypothetical protein CY35_19G016800 [Sphagnum magellanicum]|nr:hypothetical protein CY35_19G016800 [Sphagnum magellanicum]
MSIPFTPSMSGTVQISGDSYLCFDYWCNVYVAAINQINKNFACEWANDRIRVNSVCPGWTHTPLAAPALSIAATVTEIEHRVPLKRAGLPHGVAGVVAFLCSPNAAYITGQTICVEGGMTIHGFALDLSKLGT